MAFMGEEEEGEGEKIFWVPGLGNWMDGHTTSLRKGTLKGDLFEEEGSEFRFERAEFEIQNIKSYLRQHSDNGPGDKNLSYLCV